VATSDCTGKSETLSGNKAPLTVVRATIYCILALLAGAGLFAVFAYMRSSGMQAEEDGPPPQLPPTYGAIFHATTGEGGQWRSYAYRYFFASFGLFALIFYLMEAELIGPLKKCKGAPREQAPLAWDIRNTLERLKGLVWIVLALFVLGFVLSFQQHSKFESKATELETGQARKGSSMLAKMFGADKKKPSMYDLREVAKQQQQQQQPQPQQPQQGGWGGSTSSDAGSYSGGGGGGGGYNYGGSPVPPTTENPPPPLNIPINVGL
jgi:uncharacterized membrane protein YgcG